MDVPEALAAFAASMPRFIAALEGAEQRLSDARQGQAVVGSPSVHSNPSARSRAQAFSMGLSSAIADLDRGVRSDPNPVRVGDPLDDHFNSNHRRRLTTALGTDDNLDVPKKKRRCATSEVRIHKVFVYGPLSTTTRGQIVPSVVTDHGCDVLCLARVTGGEMKAVFKKYFECVLPGDTRAKETLIHLSRLMFSGS
jgi:hypothetical protein